MCPSTSLLRRLMRDAFQSSIKQSNTSFEDLNSAALFTSQIKSRNTLRVTTCSFFSYTYKTFCFQVTRSTSCSLICLNQLHWMTAAAFEPAVLHGCLGAVGLLHFISLLWLPVFYSFKIRSGMPPDGTFVSQVEM